MSEKKKKTFHLGLSRPNAKLFERICYLLVVNISALEIGTFHFKFALDSYIGDLINYNLQDNQCNCFSSNNWWFSKNPTMVHSASLAKILCPKFSSIFDSPRRKDNSVDACENVPVTYPDAIQAYNLRHSLTEAHSSTRARSKYPLYVNLLVFPCMSQIPALHILKYAVC